MNNIEILEEFIKYFEAEATQRKYRRNISITVGEDDIEAIENLIQENKELKEKQKEYEKQLDLDFVEENYIPKSKVKEIVELYDNTLQCTRKYNQDLADILCDLEELLEEGE